MSDCQKHRSGIAIAAKMRSGGPMRDKRETRESGKNYQREYLSEAEMNCVHVFVYNGEDNWKFSPVDNWDFDMVELNGSEKTLGHRQFDGVICKVVQSTNGQVFAITK